MREYGLGEDMSMPPCTVETTKLNDIQVQPKPLSRILLVSRATRGTMLWLKTVALMLKLFVQRNWRVSIARELGSSQVQMRLGRTFVFFLFVPH